MGSLEDRVGWADTAGNAAMRKLPAKREGLVGISGRHPRVFHALREDYKEHSLCSAFTRCDFFFDYSEMSEVNKEWQTNLIPCTRCFGNLQ